MGLGPSPLDELLGGDVAGRKEHGSGHARGEKRTGGKPGIVPGETVSQVVLVRVSKSYQAMTMVAVLQRQM